MRIECNLMKFIYENTKVIVLIEQCFLIKMHTNIHFGTALFDLDE